MDKKALLKKIKYDVGSLLTGLVFLGFAFVSEISADNGRELSASQNAADDRVPPVIHTDLKSSVVNDPNLFFSIEAHDDGAVTRLFVNQQPIEVHPGRHIFINHLLPLNEGENKITIKAVDGEGNETKLAPVTITKKTFDLIETEGLYSVALLPLRILAGQNISSEALYSMLLKAFDEKPGRFNFVERDWAKLEEILHEQKISNTELTFPETAIKIGKIRAAEGVFFGSVEEAGTGISITLRLVDTETTRILASARVYDEDKSLKNLEWLLYGLSLKIKRQFPIVQGNVIGVSGNGFHIDAGASSGIGVGMKLLLFREIKEGGFVLKEPIDTIARVVRVQPKSAFVEICGECPSKVEKRDLVITK